MKTPNFVTILVAFTLVGEIHAEFTSSIVYDGTVQEHLHRLDLFESYGNQQKLIDSKNSLVKFQHEHEDGTWTFKIYKLEIVERSEDVVEFHVMRQKQEGTEDHEDSHDEKNQEIDFDSAWHSFLGFPLPKGHPLEGNWGQRLTYTINAHEKDESNRDSKTQKSTAVRFSIDDDTGELKRMDIMSVTGSDEGFVGEIRAINPEQLINMKSLSVEEHQALAKQTLDKYSTPPIEKSK